MAAKKKSKSRQKPKAAKRTVVVVGKHKRKRKAAVSGTKKHKTRRKKKGFLGATGSTGIKEIAYIAGGVAIGAVAAHVVIRPLEQRFVSKYPHLGKFLAAGEILLGGYIAIKGKHSFVKSIGAGILAGGVHGGLKQIDIYKHIPQIGGGGYMESHIPIDGDFNRMVAGILEDNRRGIRTDVVAGTTRSEIVAGHDSHTSVIAGNDWEDAYDTPVKSY